MSLAQFLAVFAFGAACYCFGWVSAHLTVLEESQRLGAFYVGKSIVVVKEVKTYQEESRDER